MANNLIRAAVLFTLLSVMPVIVTAGEQSMSKRVPAEWEPQEAIWLQWPGPYEKAHETAFAKMTSVIVAYEKLHILHYSKRVRDEARDAIKRVGGDPDHENIVWHTIANDSAWMRDNGPVYVVDGDEMRIQNWVCLPFISSGVHQERRPVRRHW